MSTTGDGGFEGYANTLLLGRSKNLVAILGDQRLIGRNHMLAIGNGLKHQLTGNGSAANQLHDNIDIGVAGDFKNIGRHRHIAGIASGIFAARANLRHHNIGTYARLNRFTVTQQYIKGAATNGTQTTNAYLDGIQNRFLDHQPRFVGGRKTKARILA